MASEPDWDSEPEAQTAPLADRPAEKCDVSIQILHPDVNPATKQMMAVKALPRVPLGGLTVPLAPPSWISLALRTSVRRFAAQLR